MKLLSDIQVMDLPDLQRLVEMIRHCKKATPTLQLIAKNSFITGQLRCKKFHPYRSLLTKMFLEVFVADGDILAAETLTQERLIDSAYTENLLLVSYNVILIIIRIISCLTAKYSDNENDLFESDSFLQIVKVIIKDPFQFYNITLDLLKNNDDLTSRRSATQKLGKYFFIDNYFYLHLIDFVLSSYNFSVYGPVFLEKDFT